MIALERESESKEPPLQKTRRQRREKTTGCGRDDVYREKGAVPGNCILVLEEVHDTSLTSSNSQKGPGCFTIITHTTATSYIAPRHTSYTRLQLKLTCISGYSSARGIFCTCVFLVCMWDSAIYNTTSDLWFSENVHDLFCVAEVVTDME